MKNNYSSIMCLVSSVQLIMAYYAFSINNIHYALLSFGGFITSFNYWRHPIRNWRRNMDMFYIGMTSLYCIYKAYKTKIFIPFMVSYILGVSCYYVSCCYDKKDEHVDSIIFHIYLHFFANICAFILYSSICI